MQKTQGESLIAQSAAAVAIASSVAADERAEAHGRYIVTCTGPVEERRDEYIALRDQIDLLSAKGAQRKKILRRIWERAAGYTDDHGQLAELQARLDAIPLETKWVEPIDNLVTTEGKNFLLDNGMAGSGYTAAWYIGLISSTGYTTGPAVGDTMASHAGWTEDQNYSQAARPTTAWSGAAAGAKALSAALTYSINAPTTIKGCFLTSISTKGGTTGTLYSAGTFTGGDQPAVNGNTLSVSYSASL